MSDAGVVSTYYDFPRTRFVIALYKMTSKQRAEASAEKAAERYGLPVDQCQWWIDEARKTLDRWPIKRGER